MPRFKRRDKEYEKAAELLIGGNPEKAIPILRRIVETRPDHSNAMVSLAVALLEKQKEPTINSPEIEEAFRLLDTATKIDPKNPVPLFNKGVCYRKLGMQEEALASFEEALRIQEKQPLALLHIAEIYYELEKWDEAIEYARLAIFRDPGLTNAIPWIRTALEKAGRLEPKGTEIKKDKPRYDW